MKAQLRREVSRRIAELSEKDRKRAAGRLSDFVRSLEEYSRAGAILGFWPLDDEIDVRLLLRDAISAGKSVALPVAIVETGELKARNFSGEECLVEGAHGILEPGPNEEELSPAAVDLVIVPGRAFDHSGSRLGRGKGYYDRFLANVVGKAFRLGVAFECQVFVTIPADEHDVPVHALVTEVGVRRFGQEQGGSR